MTEQEFIKLLGETIDRKDPIMMSDDFRMYDEWCSIAYLSTIVMMSELGVESELREFKTVQDLYNAVNSK